MRIPATIAGFDWDDGNRDKCQKHGITLETIEELFSRPVLVQPDPSPAETWLREIGSTSDGRAVFLVFTLRERSGQRFIRVISARCTHRKEIASYEKENPTVHD